MTSERTWQPEIVSWNTTQRCNLRCGHCYLAAGRAASGELTLDEGRRLIDELCGLGTQMLILSGGEPLLRPDLDELVEHAAARGLLPVLGTNGLLLTRTRARRLQGVRSGGRRNQPRLDRAGKARPLPRCPRRLAPRRSRHPRLCRRGRASDRANDSPVLELRRGRGADQVRRGGVSAGFTLYFLVCTGRAETLSDISPEQYERALEALTDAQARHPRLMIRARCAPQIARVASQRGSALVSSAGCLAGRQYCRITADGKVTPCPYLPLEAGSIRERPFAEIGSAHRSCAVSATKFQPAAAGRATSASSAAVAAREPSPSPETSPARTRGAPTGPPAAPPRWGIHRSAGRGRQTSG